MPYITTKDRLKELNIMQELMFENNGYKETILKLQEEIRYYKSKELTIVNK